MEWLSGPGGSGTAEYTAGHGIDIDNEEHIISVDTDEIQEKLTAGENITIVNNVISANPQRQADWNQTDSSAADYIRNKPDLSDYATQSDLADVQGDITNIEGDILNINADLSGKADKVTGATAGNLAALDSIGNLIDSGQSSANLVHDASYVHTDNNFTTELRTKLINIEGGAEVNAIEKVKMNSIELPIDPTDRSVNIPVAAPTGQHETAGVMTPADKAKLNGIESGAEVNVQSNWAETNQASDSYIANKPDLSVYATKVSNAVENDIAVFDSTGGIKDTGVSSVNLVHDASYVHTDENFTTLLKTKLEGIQGGAEQNVQADWTEADTSSDAYIQHKPDLSVYATQTDLASKQDVLTAGSNITIQNNVISATAAPQQQADWNQTNSQSVDYIKNKPTIPSGNQLLPAATSADEDKVLTVDSNGDPIWDTPAQSTQQQADWTQTNNQSVDYIKHKPGAKPVLAGPGIQITETSNDITISTTTLSGISEIKYVQSLPASPVAGVLYLIPQT